MSWFDEFAQIQVPEIPPPEQVLWAAIAEAHGQGEADRLKSLYDAANRRYQAATRASGFIGELYRFAKRGEKPPSSWASRIDNWRRKFARIDDYIDGKLDKDGR